MITETNIFKSIKNCKTGHLTDLSIPVKGVFTNIFSDLRETIQNEAGYIGCNIDFDRYIFISDCMTEISSHKFLNPVTENKEVIRYIKDNWFDDPKTKKLYSSRYNYYIRFYEFDYKIIILLETMQASVIMLPELTVTEDELKVEQHKEGDLIKDNAGNVIGMYTRIMDEIMPTYYENDDSSQFESGVDYIKISSNDREINEKEIIEILTDNVYEVSDVSLSYGLTGEFIFYYIEPGSRILKCVDETSEVVPFLKLYEPIDFVAKVELPLFAFVDNYNNVIRTGSYAEMMNIKDNYKNFKFCELVERSLDD